MPNHNLSLLPVIRLELGLDIAACIVRHPVGLLGIVGLEHVSPLHVLRHIEVGNRIGVRLVGLPQLHVARHGGEMRWAGPVCENSVPECNANCSDNLTNE